MKYKPLAVLVMDWPDDLVAPVWQKGARSREVYLPAGRWVDFWDRARRYNGPTTLSADAPLDRIPVFIRSGQEDAIPEQ